DQKIMYLLAGIFLLINLITLGRLSYEDLPDLVFYAIAGLIALINPGSLPVFIMMGVIMVLKSMSDLDPMPLNMHLAGIVVLTAIIHLFLFVNPFGLKLNPTIRGQLGKNLSPILDGYTNEQELFNHELGEIAWKGMISLDIQDLEAISRFRNWRLVRLDNGEFEIHPKVAQLADSVPEVTAPDQM
ncbi:MAG: hypothetical protein AB1403_26580, partial [Candidatus Riflebacteria bacterium]